ncbi:MAG: hypothetical protein NT096_10590 [Proteobacteria bacterium]|nr:hypothetical protein [Pseudomonadota bacterium]
MGPKYFGISPAALEEEISHSEYSEQRGEVVPVHIDEHGRPYIEVSSSTKGKTQRLVLEEHDFILNGDISTFSIEEQKIWKARLNNSGK